ncbi:MAG: YbjN domain-containing protein [Proteobacteria bacterium]|nr:YbjN domain-containing protein [Pseudomonadota bacterium]
MSESLQLFENSREANIESTIAMVEDVLIELGHFVNDCREQPPSEGIRSWRVVKGSAMVRISLVARQDDVRLRVVSVVMTVNPMVDQSKLFRRLLTINANEIYGAAFALRGSRVLLVSERSTMDLDRGEVLDLITRVKHYADHYDDALVAEFGGVRGTAT